MSLLSMISGLNSPAARANADDLIPVLIQGQLEPISSCTLYLITRPAKPASQPQMSPVLPSKSLFYGLFRKKRFQNILRVAQELLNRLSGVR